MFCLAKTELKPSRRCWLQKQTIKKAMPEISNASVVVAHATTSFLYFFVCAHFTESYVSKRFGTDAFDGCYQRCLKQGLMKHFFAGFWIRTAEGGWMGLEENISLDANDLCASECDWVVRVNVFASGKDRRRLVASGSSQSARICTLFAGSQV